MSNEFSALRISPRRLRADFEALIAIGATSDGGVNRPAFSKDHLAARTWFRKQIALAGLECRVDGAANHSAVLACGPSGAAPLLLGGHLDSVPNGGRFDGALGVLCGLEVLRTVQENGILLSMNLEAIDFTDEEGTFLGLMGSSMLAGRHDTVALQNPRGGRAGLQSGMARAGVTDESMLSAKRNPKSLRGYLEVHIEQGTRLETAHTDIGIVTALVGASSYRLSFRGRADHSGTISMQDRRDASQGASAFTLAATDIVKSDFTNCVVNVGNMVFRPGAFNIVPASVVVSLEFRAPSDRELTKLDSLLIERAHIEATRFGLEVDIEPLGSFASTPMADVAQSAFADACNVLGLTHIPLVSGALHDAQSLAALCPVGMIFVPSVNGASHSPREFTHWNDCVNGGNVLLQAALRYAR
jgi:N-carbamoyl-L-amino-acid hydrolase